MEEKDIINLVKEAKIGNDKSFETLYSIVYKKMYSYARYSLRSAEDAEDAVMSAVTDAYTGIKRLRDEDKFTAWIMTILQAKINRAIKQYYKNEVDSEETDTAFTLDNTNLRADIAAAIAKLDLQSRQIVVLSYIYGYKGEEIAEIMDLNHATVRTKQRRALQKLREEISDE